MNILRPCCRGNFLSPGKLVLINNKIEIPGLVSRRSRGNPIINPVFNPTDTAVTHGDITLAPTEYVTDEDRCYNKYRGY